LSEIAWTVDRALQAFFDTVIIPLEKAPGWVSLTAVSAVTGVLFVWLYSFISPQNRIRAVKRSIGRSMYEAVLFRRDPILSMRAQWDLMCASFAYLALAIVPVMILSIPGAIWMSQFYYRLGKAPVVSEAIIHGVVANAATLNGLDLSSDGGATVGPVVRRPATGTFIAKASIRLTGEEAGVSVSIAGERVRIPIVTNPQMKPVEIRGRLDVESFLVPAGRIVRSPSAVTQMWVEYPDLTLGYLGGMTWIVAFVLLSLIFGYLGGRILGVAL
jgi:hypothetical protein